MVTIKNFDDALHYVNRLGMGRGNGRPISWVQQNLCAVTDALAATAGGYQYNVHFSRKVHGNYGEFSVYRPGALDNPLAVREDKIVGLQ